jgi:hypothetical protein
MGNKSEKVREYAGNALRYLGREYVSVHTKNLKWAVSTTAVGVTVYEVVEQVAPLRRGRDLNPRYLAVYALSKLRALGHYATSPRWRVQKRANREQTYIVFENLGDHEKFDTGDRRATIQWLDSNKYKARVTLYPIPPSPRR